MNSALLGPLSVRGRVLASLEGAQAAGGMVLALVLSAPHSSDLRQVPSLVWEASPADKTCALTWCRWLMAAWGTFSPLRRRDSFGSFVQVCKGVLHVELLEKLDRNVGDEVLEVYQVFKITPP